MRNGSAIKVALCAVLLMGAPSLQANSLLWSHGPNPGIHADVSNPLFDSIVACYDLDDATDSSENGYTLTNNNSVTFVSGLVGNAGDFVLTSSQYLSRADNADLSVTGDYSVSAWVNLDNISTTAQAIVSKQGASVFEYRIQHRDGGPVEAFEVGHFYGGGASLTTLTSLDHNDISGVWWHVVYRFRASDKNMSLWVNGVEEATDTLGGTASDTTAAFAVGAYAAPSNYTNGVIDQVMVWQKYVSSDEIAELYNSGAGLGCP